MRRTSKGVSANTRPELAKSELIAAMPVACSDETAAVELFEKQRWGDCPACAHCGSVSVYKMTSTKGGRNKRFLWRCRDCEQQYTVRIGTVYEESRLPMKVWAYAFWRAATSKKGVAAMEIMRDCQVSYKTALFVLHRIRFAMAPDHATAPKLIGTIECDETYVGGKPRPGDGKIHKKGRGTSKTPVFAMVERGGQIRRKVIPTVSGSNLKAAMEECVDPSSRIMTDELPAYRKAVREFAGGHETVSHRAGEYARGDVNTNTAESSFALVKRGLIGIHHNVSKEHLHRYIAHYDFLWNTRDMNDGHRVSEAIRAADGKRLTYADQTGN